MIKLFFVVFSIFLFSCSPYKSTSSVNKKSHYINFYVSDSTTQYFIKPLVLNGGGLKVYTDYTFLKLNGLIDNFTLRYSIISEKPLTETRLKFDKIEILNSKLLYREMQSKKYVYRYECTLPFKLLFSSFINKNSKILLNEEILYFSKNTNKKLDDINKELSFELNMK